MSAFRHSRTFAAKPESVFAAFQDPCLLARWWGPEGFTNTFDTFEFRPGGKWLFTMHGPDGKNYPNESEFLEIIAPTLVRIRHVNLPRFDLSVSLQACPEGTKLVWVAFFENGEFAEGLRQFLETANEQNLDRLAAVLARPQA